MEDVRIAVVAIDERVRTQLARCFDTAPRNWRVALFEAPPPDADLIVSNDPRADVVVDPSNASSVVTQIEAFLRARVQTRVVSVAGTCGGCGVTTVALHLSRALATMSPTAYLENDPAARSAAPRLGMRSDARTWQGDDVGFGGLPVAGFRVFPAPAEGAGRSLADRLSGDFGFVVAEPMLPDRLDAGVLVVSPTPVGARRAAELIPTLPDLPWAVVVNHTAPGEALRSSDVAEITGVEPTLTLPFSPGVRRAEMTGRLASRWTRFSRQVDRLARSLTEAT